MIQIYQNKNKIISANLISLPNLPNLPNIPHQNITKQKYESYKLKFVNTKNGYSTVDVTSLRIIYPTYLI